MVRNIGETEMSYYRKNPEIQHNGRRFWFCWKSAYMGTMAYEIHDGTASYRAELRTHLGDYERSIVCYDADGIAKHLESAIGLLVRCVADNGGEIDADTIAAFNAWRQREHESMLAFMISQPERFGDAETLRREFPAPMPVSAGHWTQADGWRRVELAEAA